MLAMISRLLLLRTDQSQLQKADKDCNISLADGDSIRRRRLSVERADGVREESHI
jgi:hypothetical protein